MHCTFTVVACDTKDDVIVFGITIMISYSGENMSHDTSRSLKYRISQKIHSSLFVICCIYHFWARNLMLYILFPMVAITHREFER